MDLPTRWRAHNKLKTWFREAAVATLQHFNTRTEVLAAEVEAIKTGRPLVNVKHNNVLPVDPDRMDRLGKPSRRSPQVPLVELEQRMRGGEWLLTGSVARLLEVNRFTVGKMIDAGRIRYRKDVGGAKHPQRRCCPEDVIELLDESRQVRGGKSAPPPSSE
jgi:hypothetical protein